MARAVAARAVPLTPSGSGLLLSAAKWPGDGTVGYGDCPFDLDEIPDHPNRLTAYEALRDQSLPPADEPGSLAGTVVLVDRELERERLCVIPQSWARSELRTFATLRFARSYRNVLADEDAVQTVVDAMGPMRDEHGEDLTERELFERLVAEDAPFDADEFFGHEDWRQWIPAHEKSTAGFAESSAPLLWDRYKQPDGGWGIDYDPTDYLPAEDEAQILAELQVLGCEILPCPGLVGQYYGPDPDLVARIDAGEWPPRPKVSRPVPESHGQGE